MSPALRSRAIVGALLVASLAPLGAHAQTAAQSAPAVPSVATPPHDWQLLDLATDSLPGISLRKAQRELLANKQPRRTVVVAVIDGGTDTAHAALRGALWSNPRETTTGKDGDGDGHVGDIHGWDFIGGPTGDVDQDTYELTRQYARCQAGANAKPALTSAENARCPDIAIKYTQKRDEAQQNLAQYTKFEQVVQQIMPMLRTALHSDSVTPQAVAAFQPTTPELTRAKLVYQQILALGATPKDIDDGYKELTTEVKYSLDPAFDPRGVVGDNYLDVTQSNYGNADYTGPDAMHGTHVAGIIAASPDNPVGIQGVAPMAKLMIVRTIPDGDERDKDVANAIRYAVDHGANVINMSFGKDLSPFKGAVDDAVRYADSKGVLMIHAAGNDGANNDSTANFPTPVYLNGGRAANWIEVGATSWHRGDSLVANFSNYGAHTVDVFAPGVDILSTLPGGIYDRMSGTSMASPVVTGLAALIMSYYPSLTAADVRRIIVESAVKDDEMVIKPNSAERVPFSSLSISGGIVNAYAALRMADSYKH